MPLLGNTDGYGVLVEGKTGDVENPVKEAIEIGVDGIWRTCDIWRTAPKEHMGVFLDAAREYGTL